MADGVHTIDGARECQRLRSKSAALEGMLDRASATKLKVIAVIRAVELSASFKPVISNLSDGAGFVFTKAL
jgi:hypothetical protein